MCKQATLTQEKYVLYSQTFSQFMGTIFEYYISTLHGSCENEWNTWRLAYSRAYMACFSIRDQSLQSQYIDTFTALKFCYFCWSKTIRDSFRELVPFTPFSCAYIITIAWNGLKSIIILSNNYQYADTVASLKAETENMLCVQARHIERFEIEVQVSKRRFRI